MTKGNCENSLPKEDFGVNMELLPFPWNISKNNMADYQEVQVCQVRHRDLVEVLGNRVDVLDNSGAVVHLNALVSGQNIGMGSVKTSFFQDFAFSFPTKNHVSYSVVNTMLNWFTVAAVTNFSFKRVEADKPMNKVKLGEPPPWIVYRRKLGNL